MFLTSAYLTYFSYMPFRVTLVTRDNVTCAMILLAYSVLFPYCCLSLALFEFKHFHNLGVSQTGCSERLDVNHAGTPKRAPVSSLQSPELGTRVDCGRGCNGWAKTTAVPATPREVICR
jgi:hypothetical protein